MTQGFRRLGISMQSSDDKDMKVISVETTCSCTRAPESKDSRIFLVLSPTNKTVVWCLTTRRVAVRSGRGINKGVS